MTTTLSNVLPADDTAGGYGNGYEPTGDLQLALDELNGAKPEYVEAEQYYDDERPEVFTSTRMRAALSRGDVNFKVNFACKPVDTLAERLEIASVTAIGDNKQAADTWIETFIESNQMATAHKDTMLAACEYGDAYVMVWPTDLDDPSKGVDIYLNKPHGCRVFYDPEKPHIKAFGVKRWMLTASRQVRIDMYYPKHIERYITKEGVAESTSAADFVPFFEDGDYDPDMLEPGQAPPWPANPYGIPIFHFRNRHPYGVPEHKRFWGTQDILRKLIMGHVSGVDYQSAPQRAALLEAGYSPDDADDDEGNFGFPANGSDEGVSTAASQRSNLEGGSDTVWWLKGVKDLITLDPADPAVFTNPMLVYLRFGAQIVDMPLYRIDPTGSIPSGESRRVAEGPFVLKVIDRQERYRPVWRDIYQFALQIVGITASVMIHWKSPAIVDDQTGWTTLLSKLQAGLPLRQAFAEQGYTQEQIEKWFGREGERDETDLMGIAEVVLKIGQALQALGSAAGFGTIDPERIDALIDALLTKIGGQATDHDDTERDAPPPVEKPQPGGDDDRALATSTSD